MEKQKVKNSYSIILLFCYSCCLVDMLFRRDNAISYVLVTLNIYFGISIEVVKNHIQIWKIANTLKEEKNLEPYSGLHKSLRISVIWDEIFSFLAFVWRKFLIFYRCHLKNNLHSTLFFIICAEIFGIYSSVITYKYIFIISFWCSVIWNIYLLL